jgi:hypothetical protein
MDILEQLSSATGARTQDANRRAAERCLAAPDGALIERIAAGLSAGDVRLLGDCAEVLTQVAEARPELVAPFAARLLALVTHRNGRVRWEAAHALALVADRVPALLAGALPDLGEIIRGDASVIVRDYLLDAVAGYASTSARAAGEALPILRDGLRIFDRKHAARVLRSLAALRACHPALTEEIRALAEPFREDPRPGVRKAAAPLLRPL